MPQYLQNNESKHSGFGRFFKLSAPILRFIATLVVGFITQNSYAAFSGKVIYNYVTDPTIQFSSPETACQAYLKTEQAGFGYPLTFQRAEAVSTGPLSDYTCYSTHSNPSATNPYLWLYVVRTNPQCGANADGSASGNAIVCTCQSGFVERHNSCVPAGAETTTPIVSKNAGGGTSCNLIGNPINPGTGSKYLLETDYVSGSMPLELRFERSYNSQYDSLAGNQNLGMGWRHNYSRSLILDTTDPTIKAEVLRADGRSVSFTKTTSGFVADPGVSDKLVSITSTSGAPAYDFTEAETGNTETFNTNGQLISIRNLAGWSQVLSYSDTTTPPAIASVAGLLIEVKDQSARILQLRYNTINQLTTLIDPAGLTYTYSYDLADNLVGLTFPDSKIRTYLYENSLSGGSGLLHALTGILDENSARFSTYEYDISGKAFRTEHAGGALKYVVTYNADGSSTVVDPLVTSRTYNFSVVQNVSSPAGVSQPCTSCGGTASSTTYDVGGNALTRVDFNGNQTCYAYDVQGRNLEVARVEGLANGANCTTALAAMTQSGVARKITTDWHPTFRLPIKITESGRETSYAYDSASGNVLTKSIKDLASGKLRSWTYGYTTAADGTLPNLLKTVDGPRTDVADITTYAYKPNGDLATVTNALGHITQISQSDAHGKPLTVVDPNGLTTTLSYFPRGWLKTKTVGTETTSYSYDNVGQLKQVTLPTASTIRYTYDDAHRLTDITDHINNRIHYGLDAMGNRVKEETFDASNTLTTTQSRVFDSLNRLWQEIGNVNLTPTTTTYTYDANGNLKTRTDPLNHTTTLAYDALNRLSQATDALADVTQYGYDPLDQVTRITDPRLAATNYTVNALGEHTQQVSPDSGTATRIFDTAGNLITETDARGVTANYAYDALNRLTNVSYPVASENIQYTWDSAAGCTYGIGRLCRQTDGSGLATYTYDAFGNVLTQSRTVGSTVTSFQYSYDAGNHLQTVSYPDGSIVTYTRDVMRRITGINRAANGITTPLLSNRQYRADGLMISQLFGNGLNETRQYDLQGRLLHQTLGAVDVRDYNYDLNGNLKALSAPALNGVYGYDALDRLLTESSVVTHNFSYDQNGNRVQDNGTSYVYAPSSNRLSSINGASLTLDPAGNTLTDAAGRTFTFNNAGGLATVSKGGVLKANYVYDASHRRTQKMLPNGTDIRYHYSPAGDLLAETNALGQLLQAYILADSVPVALINGDQDGDGVLDALDNCIYAANPDQRDTDNDGYGNMCDADLNNDGLVNSLDLSRFKQVFSTNNADADLNGDGIVNSLDLGLFKQLFFKPPGPSGTKGQAGPATVSYLYTDHLGSPRLATDVTAKIVWRNDGNAFGDTLANEDVDGDGRRTIVNLRFPGQYFDQETGLHQNRFRTYDPGIGRYISSDPIGLEGGVNTYSYVDGNPLSFIDPLGLAKCDVAKSGMLGERGVQTASKTLWKGKSKARIDVENPSPGQRPGQLHYQDGVGNKYLYDPATNAFPNAPKSVNKLLEDPKFQKAIEKGLTKYLGE